MPQKSHQVPESWEPPTKALAGGWQQALQDGVLQSQHHLLPWEAPWAGVRVILPPSVGMGDSTPENTHP